MLMESVAFNEIFDMETLQRLMNSLSKSLEVGLCVRSPEGKRLIEDSVYCTFCQNVIQHSALGKRQCEESDVTLSAYKEKSPMICRCKSAGLMDVGINLMVDGVHIASILVGQVRLKENELSEEEYRQIARSLQLDEDAYMEGLNKIPVITREKFDSILETLTLVAGQLSQLGYHNLQQRKKISVLENAESTLQRDREQLQILAERDNLTGLYNRTKFEALMQEYGVQGHRRICIISGDANHLKLMNDVFGHEAGDILLQAIAGKLTELVKSSWMTARCGGDEFRVLMPDTELITAEDYCDRVTRNCKSEKRLNLPLSIALGAAEWDSESESLQECFNRADKQMYENKALMKQEQDVLDYILNKLYDKQYLQWEIVPKTAAMAYDFATHLGFDEEGARKVRLTALYQDIGLIQLPEFMMIKGFSATAEEMSNRRGHVEKGYQIALQLDQTRHIADFIRCSHENWDGGGYPRMLKGQKIPLESRIVRVVDNYVYWTTHMQKGTNLTREQAIARLRGQAGKMYDPDVVEWFISYLGEDY